MNCKRLKELREERGMTLYELGEKVGVTASAVCLYEKGIRKPRLDTFAKFCEVLGADPKELM